MEKLNVLLACVFGLCVSSANYVRTPASFPIAPLAQNKPILAIETETPILPQQGVPNTPPPIVYSSTTDPVAGILAAQNRLITGILSVADSLSGAFGSRPPYDGTKFNKGDKLSRADAIYVLPYIFTCESRNKDVKTLDSNNRFSYGRGQIQKATWKRWSSESGVIGDPMNATDTVAQSLWALQNGKIGEWTCARLEKIIE